MSIIKYQESPKEIQKDFQRSVCLAEKLEEFLEDNPKINETIPDRYPKTKFKSKFTASSVGAKSGKSLCGKYPMGCARHLYYKVTGVKTKRIIPGSLRKRWNAGSALHVMFQKYLLAMTRQRKYGLSDAIAEYEIVPELGGLAKQYQVIGKVDFFYKVDGFPCISEIKTMAEKQFSELSSPSKEHVIQLNMYMALLDIPVGSLFYVGFCPDVPVKEFIIEFDPKIWEAAKTKMDHILELAAKGEEPEAEGNMWACKGCPYGWICKPIHLPMVKGDVL